jgi:uncharacterized protein with von Willebrand factor type A (vWA) domain
VTAQQQEAGASFTVLLPLDLRDSLIRRARLEDMSAGALTRRALRWYLGEPVRGENGALKPNP